MICALGNLLVAVTALGLVVAATVFMVSPKHGGELMRRLAVFFIVALFALCLLRQLLAQIGTVSLLLLGVVVSIVSFLVREGRHDRPLRRVNHHGAERTPILPPHSNEEVQP